jgi:hypothetical protein
MKTINRTAITIQTKQPYIDWANSFEDGQSYDPEKCHATTILISDRYDEFNYEKYLKKIYKILFEEELESWMADPDGWPKIKNYKMFKEWFEIICSDMTWDYGTGDIEHEAL